MDQVHGNVRTKKRDEVPGETSDERVKHVVVIIGHPIQGSLSHSAAKRYVDGLVSKDARSGSASSPRVTVIDLADELNVPSALPTKDQLRAKTGRGHLDPRVVKWIEIIESADHLAWFFPQWWGTYPAVLKVFIDSVFLSGISFTYEGALPKGLWKGRTSRVFATMDSPHWWNRLWYRNAMLTSLNRAVLCYVGILPRNSVVLTPVRGASPKVFDKWLNRVGSVARKDVRLLAKGGALMCSK